MRILFVSQYFYPEIFRGNDICFDLARRGNDVTVVCAVPNYPQGTFFKGYGLFQRRKEIVKGVKVIRVPVIPRGEGGGVRLVMNYFSYAIIASLYTMYLAVVKKYDRIIVQQLSPVLISVPAIVFKKIQKKPLYTWVLDLWPESLMAAGGIQNKRILNIFEWFAKLEYKHSDKILISSRCFTKSILDKGDYENKIVYFPNWAEDVYQNNNNSEVVISDLPQGFKVIFAGNVGEAQDFEHIMEATLYLKKEKNIKFIIIGDGRKLPWVIDFVKENSLEETVLLLGRYPMEYMPAFFEKADIMLVALKNEEIFKLTAPAKLQAYMSSAKPIIGMISGEGAELVQKAQCGYCVDAGDAIELANMILKMSLLTKEDLTQLGCNGLIFCQQYFDKKKCMNHLNAIITD